MVHGSGGINLPASKALKSEVRIVAGIAKATVGSDVVDWDALSDDNDMIRDLIARVLPAFGNYNEDVRKPRGFHLYNSAAERDWKTPTGRANFSDSDLPDQTEWQRTQSDDQTFVLQTFRSHDQYNTTVYGMDDRYRGVYGERQVVLMHPKDIALVNGTPGERVNVVGCYNDGVERVAQGFRLVPYDIPRGWLLPGTECARSLSGVRGQEFYTCLKIRSRALRNSGAIGMEDALIKTVSTLLDQNPEGLSPLAAGVLAAAHHGLTQDSRSFAAKLGVAHALVLRECIALSEEIGAIVLDDRQDRSQRVFFSLTQQGRHLLAGGEMT